MPTNYVLIDYENVQPSNLELLDDKNFKVIVFCGFSQNNISFELATGMQKMGDGGQYVKSAGNGKNSLDFHMAFHIGRLSIEDPRARIHIVSKDKGFEPLVAHLKSHGIKACRVDDIAKIPVLRVRNAGRSEDKIAVIVKNLVGRGRSLPGRVETLRNTINSLFAEKMKDDELKVILDELQAKKYIEIDGEKISYKLPNQA